MGWIANERALSCEKCHYLKDCASNRSETAIGGAANTLDQADFVAALS
jgi:hypothetical protein